jgi:branched-chain amino acid transport system ATP-binding protein
VRTSSAEAAVPHLVVSDLAAGYGGTPVVEDVDLVVNREEVVTIVGPNGAGKSTVLKALVGVIRPLAGRVVLGGTDLTGLSTDQICRRSVGYVPQLRDTFPRLTVKENLEMGGYALRRSEVRARIDEVVGVFPALGALLRRQGGHLSGGERKMLAMARVLMTRPTLMVLDEPTAGLAPKLADDVLSTQVAMLANAGVSLLIVEQRAREALSISDRAYVMAGGRIVLADGAETLLARPDIADVFLGRAVEAVS